MERLNLKKDGHENTLNENIKNIIRSIHIHSENTKTYMFQYGSYMSDPIQIQKVNDKS